MVPTPTDRRGTSENLNMIFVVDLIQAEAIDIEQVEGSLRHRQRDAAIGAHLRIVADAAQQRLGDTRCAAATAGNSSAAPSSISTLSRAPSG